jgi:hypothetical protein
MRKVVTGRNIGKIVAPAPVPPGEGVRGRSKIVGWQGFTVDVPETWDLTGFSGDENDGYLRIDDSAEQGVELKWGTHSEKAKDEPDPEVRRESYFDTLAKTAKKKKLPLATKEADDPRYARRDDRLVTGFSWTGDRKAVGAVWYCRTCRRVVIAQVLGDTAGRGLTATAERILNGVSCHGDDPAWRTWALYDLHTRIPAEYRLESQQLMNVYLRLTFAHRQSRAARLSVEQWSLANVARKDEFLDVWLSLNTKAELRNAAYSAEEGTANGHDALLLSGGPRVGGPWVEVVKQALRFERPATKFTAVAWECEASNKVYLVQAMRPGRVTDPVAGVAERTRCHATAGVGAEQEVGPEAEGPGEA